MKKKYKYTDDEIIVLYANGAHSPSEDLDGDGKVNMSEAHYYARSHDSRNEHPTIGSCITHACDATLFPKLALIKNLPVKKK